MIAFALRFVLAVAVLGATTPARAAEIAPATDPAGKPALVLTGIIAPGDEAKLSAALARSPQPMSLHLRSLGGNVEAALALGALVQREGLSTAVPARTVCASACGLVWLAGTPRILEQDAHVGLHAAYLRRNGVSVETGAANALIGSYLGRLGFGDKAIVYLTSAAPDDMTWIQPADRQRYGITFDSAAVPASRPPTEPAWEEHFLSKPMAFAGAIASTAVAAMNRLMGRQQPTSAVPSAR